LSFQYSRASFYSETRSSWVHDGVKHVSSTHELRLIMIWVDRGEDSGWRQNAELRVIGTEIIAVILSACKRVRLWQSKSKFETLFREESIVFKTTKQSHKTNQFTRIRSLISKSLEEEEKPNLYETEDDKNKVVLYFTSLRGIRKTYEDCCCVRTVVRGYQVAVEERGISMDSKYRI